MIDHQRKLLFVHIARTGGTSVETALVNQDWWSVQPDTKHISASMARAEYGEEIWDSYTTFTVVRNPWDRIGSMWATGWWAEALNFEKDCSLEHFVRNLAPHPNERYDSLLYTDILDEPLDFVLRFESLQADFRKMFRSLGKQPPVLPHVLKRKRRPISELYNETTKSLVAQMCASDIRKFDYQFPESARHWFGASRRKRA